MSNETTTPPEPKWGDPISDIPPERQDELRKLAEAQRAWLAATGPDRDAKQSPFAEAHTRLTGAEVFFLAVEAIAAEQGRALDAVEWRVREELYVSHATLHLEGAFLLEAHLEGARLFQAHLEGAYLGFAHLGSANLEQAHLEGARLLQAHLEGAKLEQAHLEGANLEQAHLEGASLRATHLEGADLRLAFFSTATDLEGATIADKEYGAARVADVRWQEVNLAVIPQWGEVERLGDERAARALAKQPLPKGASRADREEVREVRRYELLAAWREAARANRQLASVMRDQGMNDEADHFAYQGQLCQRQVYRFAGHSFRRGLSRFLDLIAGYGYKPERSLIAYLLIIFGFALAYFFIGQTAGPQLSPFGAFVFSMTSFHGRGFFPGGISIDDPLTGTAAFEALAGLIIEISFIATFTQRFFGR